MPRAQASRYALRWSVPDLAAVEALRRGAPPSRVGGRVCCYIGRWFARRRRPRALTDDNVIAGEDGEEEGSEEEGPGLEPID